MNVILSMEDHHYGAYDVCSHSDVFSPASTCRPVQTIIDEQKKNQNYSNHHNPGAVITTSACSKMSPPLSHSPHHLLEHFIQLPGSER